MSAANESDSGSCDGLHCSGPTGEARVDDFGVQGTPDILAQLSARVTYEMTAAERHIALAKANAMRYDEGAAWARHRLAIKMLAWIDELSECQSNSTAPDTTSGSAGVP